MIIKTFEQWMSDAFIIIVILMWIIPLKGDDSRKMGNLISYQHSLFISYLCLYELLFWI